MRGMRKKCVWARPLCLDGVRLRSQASHQAVILNPSKGSLQLNLHTGIVLLYPGGVILIWYWTAPGFLHEGGLSRRHWLGGVVHVNKHHSTASELLFRKWARHYCMGVL
jgi:hypothetical protein